MDLLLIMLPFWTNLLIRTYALIAVLRSRATSTSPSQWLWTTASWLDDHGRFAAAR